MRRLKLKRAFGFASLVATPHVHGELAAASPDNEIGPRIIEVEQNVGAKAQQSDRCVDDYVLLEELGKGAMGAVYRAHRTGVEKTLAIKKMHAKFASEKSSLERFQQEARAASLLSHANLVSIYEFGVANDGAPYLVMDLVDGVSLSQLLKQQHQLPAARVIDIFQQVCDGLAHAHAKAIIHRDLKPGNIMLGKTEDELDLVKIVDFGIAKLIPKAQTHHERMTQTGEVIGSPVYMSPEQCVGSPLDQRSDVYSVGCVMYEALMGAPPFTGNNIVQTILAHLNEKPMPFATRRPDLSVPESLERIVMKCLEKAPSQRFQSMQDLRDELELLGENVSATRRKFLVSRVRRTKLSRFLKRREKLLLAVGACVLTIALGAVFLSRAASDDRLIGQHVNAAEVALLKDDIKAADRHWKLALSEAIRLKKSPKVVAALHMSLANSQIQRSATSKDPPNISEALANVRAAKKLLSDAPNAMAERLHVNQVLYDLLTNVSKRDLAMYPEVASQQASRLMLEGDAAFKQQRMEEAAAKYSAALDISPFNDSARRNLTIALNNRAVKLMQQNKLNEALQLFLQAVRTDPNYTLGKHNVAVAMNNTGLLAPKGHQSAWFRKALYFDPNSSSPKANLKVIYELGAEKQPKTLSDWQAQVLADIKNRDFYCALADIDSCRQLDANSFSENARSALQELADGVGESSAHKDSVELIELLRERLGDKITRPAGCVEAVWEGNELAKHLLGTKQYAEAEKVLCSYPAILNPSSGKQYDDERRANDETRRLGSLLVAQAMQEKWTEARATASSYLESFGTQPVESLEALGPLDRYLKAALERGSRADRDIAADALLRLVKRYALRSPFEGDSGIQNGSGGFQSRLNLP